MEGRKRRREKIGIVCPFFVAICSGGGLYILIYIYFCLPCLRIKKNSLRRNFGDSDVMCCESQGISKSVTAPSNE